MPLRKTRHFIWAQRHFLALAIVLGIVFAAWCVYNRQTIADYLRSYDRRNELRAEVDRLQEETRKLEEEHEKLQQGGIETEKVARERFRFSKPGEGVLYLDPPATPTPGS